MLKTLRLTAAALVLLPVLAATACSHTPAAASGTAPDTALASLSPIPFPAQLNPADPYTRLPTVATASGAGVTIALQVAGGACNVVIGTAGSQTQVGAHAPGTGQPAPAQKTDLPPAAARAIGPANSAATTTADGPFTLTCGDRGAALTLPAKDVAAPPVGTARIRNIGNGLALIVTGSATTMAAALA
ncbi:hypothetical protein [Streptacidiphilus albus]|uniref:hypothetical protein n=1 Tax=Streptacidiphilus albus TaxID=105425 RepID=UPI00054C13B2|nr:hypothetical protein [Streptacidiphilus albus]